MNRRDLFKTAAALVAAAPLIASAEDWSPSVLDDHQSRTVIALTDLIIPETDTPGAKTAHVNRYIDLLLRDGDPTQRENFFAGLNSLDGDALRKYGHPFVSSTPAQQTAILTAIEDTPFFRQAKELTSQIYYATEIGRRELNKGGRVPASFGCRHTSHG